MKKLITIALIALPAASFASPSAELAAAVANFCGSNAKIAVKFKTRAKEGVPFKEALDDFRLASGNLDETLTPHRRNRRAMEEVVFGDAYYKYRTFGNDALESLSYIQCQTMMSN